MWVLGVYALLATTAAWARCRTEVLDTARAEALFGAADQVFEGRLLRLEVDRVSQSAGRRAPYTCQDTADVPAMERIEITSGPTDTPDATAVFEVLRHWKGAPAARMTVRVGSGAGWRVRERYLVFAHHTDVRGRAVRQPQVRLGCWPSVYALDGSGRRDPVALVQHLHQLPPPGSGGTLQLQLVDLHGRTPLAALDVMLEGPQGLVRGISDANGEAVLAGLPAGTYVWRSAPPPDRRWSCAPCAPLVLPDRGRVVQHWTAQGEADLTVAVEDAAGQPVRAALRLVLLDGVTGQPHPWALHPSFADPPTYAGPAVLGSVVVGLLLQEDGNWPLDEADPALRRVYTQGTAWTAAPRIELRAGSTQVERFVLPAALTPVQTTVQLTGYTHPDRPLVMLQVGSHWAAPAYDPATRGTRFTVHSLPGQSVSLQVHVHQLADEQGVWHERLLLRTGHTLTVPVRGVP